jgi:hypothetical protein
MGSDLVDGRASVAVEGKEAKDEVLEVVAEVSAVPWMQSSTFNYEATREELLQTLANKQQAQQAAAQQPMTKPVKVKRSAPMV